MHRPPYLLPKRRPDGALRGALRVPPLLEPNRFPLLLLPLVALCPCEDELGDFPN